ncbi:hypothetical protein SLA2020_428180 [Shorea laevis]
MEASSITPPLEKLTKEHKGLMKETTIKAKSSGASLSSNKKEKLSMFNAYSFKERMIAQLLLPQQRRGAQQSLSKWMGGFGHPLPHNRDGHANLSYNKGGGRAVHTFSIYNSC